MQDAFDQATIEIDEVLRVVNRSGNRPSQEGAAEQADKATALCRQAGFRRIAGTKRA